MEETQNCVVCSGWEAAYISLGANHLLGVVELHPPLQRLREAKLPGLVWTVAQVVPRLHPQDTVTPGY